jgi:predicted O-linked N-acetylglucosamine transferase (SPINDLY family)
VDQHALTSDFSNSSGAPQNPIRIGWITPRLLSGPMKTFFLGVLRNLPRNGVEHWLYSTHPARDKTSAEFEMAADQFIDVSGTGEEELVNKLRSDDLTVAVELSGHGPHHSLRVMSRRIAPLQCSWLDYFHPTEIPAIDFFISDSVLSRGAVQSTNRFLDLPDGRLCADFSGHEISISPVRPSRIRFGCFNRLSKLSDELIRAWSGLLEVNTEAELELRSLHFHDSETRARWASHAAGLGLPIDRVKMIGWSTWEETLKAYQDIDLALDSYPFSGCATSADALYMGVPVITTMGQTLVSRQTASLLKHAGFDEWIANDLADYSDLASDIARSGTRSSKLRQSIREQFLNRQGNVKLFATRLEEALIAMTKSMSKEN